MKKEEYYFNDPLHPTDPPMEFDDDDEDEED